MIHEKSSQIINKIEFYETEGQITQTLLNHRNLV